ncbi:hypothetical protein [Dethiobacter alkaliphilus]|uniref:hypothetical protein n=1 Tax=Dethiobacter alkaliphilus TaxID=427926 RepID=UPI002227D65D|nr:hypothetical protein [Dethiobacter alkaliphilus]MCW3488674.1 hypothetical protein [Dethiobacter alkaliphilus]
MFDERWWQRYQELPENQKEAILEQLAGQISENFFKLSREIDLDDTEILFLIRGVLHGQWPPSQLAGKFREELGLEEWLADALYTEVDEKIFSLIRDVLNRLDEPEYDLFSVSAQNRNEEADAGTESRMEPLHPSGNEDRAMQVREILCFISAKVAKPLRQSWQEAEHKRDAGLQSAKERLDLANRQISNLREEAKIGKVHFSSLDEMKSKLAKQVEGVTDPAQVAEEYVMQAKKHLKNNDEELSCIVLVLSVVFVIAAFIFIMIMVGTFFAAWVGAFLAGGLLYGLIMLKAGDRSDYKRVRSAALADLVLDLWRKKISAEYDNACSEVRSRFQQETERINPRFYPLMAQANDRVREFNAGVSLAEAPWDHPYWQDWSPAKEPAVSLRFGTVRVDTSW